MKKVLHLTIPSKLIKEPIIYKMVTRYDLIPTILSANLSKEEVGAVTLEVDGTPANLERGILFLKELDIQVNEKN